MQDVETLKLAAKVAVPLFGVLALLFAALKASLVLKADAGTDRMKQISGFIHQGAMAFLGREYRAISLFAAVVALVLLYLGYTQKTPWVFACFLYGAFSSGLSGFFGMKAATRSNVRAANAARTSLNAALGVAFSGGSVMGMCVVGLGVVGLGVLYIIFGAIPEPMTTISGFGLGASSIALFARVGGGIYTKAADVGADLVGKIEAGIPEDDPRNPAVIADLVGDNVGDVAGMGADLFESFVGSIIAAMVIGVAMTDHSVRGIMYPLALACVGIVASILGTFIVRTAEGSNPQKALNNGTFLAGFLMIVGSYFLTVKMLPASFTFGGGAAYTATGAFLATVAGLVAGILIGLLTEYYTAEGKPPSVGIAKASETGPATTIIAGLSVGMRSTAFPVIVLAAGVVAAYLLAGLYGIALAGLGMLSTTGIVLAVDAYGPIADNSGGIAEMSELPPEVRRRTDKLDAVGNTTAAIGKGFAIGSAALTALALFSAFTQKAGLMKIDIMNPYVVAGLLIGAMMPFLFCSMAIGAVGSAAFDMIGEVRRQFREIPGLMEGKATADYARCVDISTRAAIRRMIVPGVLAVAVPIVAGWLDKEFLGGLLAGVTASGVMLAIFQANAGGSWDNAKKYIEAGNLGGKGSPAHKAAVVGDTVGDPFKDTSGPSLNILIKLMSIVSLVFAPLLF
ncbi:MAG: sodium-translocating pyrophosphatase [bacterium]